MRNPASVLIVVLLLGSSPGEQANASEETVCPQSAHAPVVELFTSQGCSSCLGVDAQLYEAVGKGGGLLLAHHVDYWDEQGWRDPFSSPEATQRQARYVRSLGLRMAATPQWVLNGERSGLGSAANPGVMGTPTSPVSIQVSEGSNHVVVDIGEQAGERNADVLLLAVLDRAETQVRGGENGGRVMIDHNVVLSTTLVGHWRGRATRLETGRSGVPLRATHIVVLLQQYGQRQILAVRCLPL